MRGQCSSSMCHIFNALKFFHILLCLISSQQSTSNLCNTSSLSDRLSVHQGIGLNFGELTFYKGIDICAVILVMSGLRRALLTVKVPLCNDKTTLLLGTLQIKTCSQCMLQLYCCSVITIYRTKAIISFLFYKSKVFIYL